MVDINNLIIDNLEVWSSAIQQKKTTGRGSSKKVSLVGIDNLRDLIIELALQGKLIKQDENDTPVSHLIDEVKVKREELTKKKLIKRQSTKVNYELSEKPYAIPSSWEWSSIGELCQITPKNELEDNIEASFIPMPMISTSYSGEHDQEVKKWGEIKKGFTHFADGDIALAKITPCFENSKAAIFKGLKNGVGSGTTELHVARPLIEKVNARYLLLFLKSPRFLSAGESKMTGSAGQKRVPKDFFTTYSLPLAPVEEQSRIVAKVDELMVLCDQLEQQTEVSIDAHKLLVEELLSTLTNSENGQEFEQNWARIAEYFDLLFTTEHSIEQLKQTILQLAVMGKLVSQDPNDEPASVLRNKLKKEKEKLLSQKEAKDSGKMHPKAPKEPAYKIPKNWEWVRFRELIWCFRGHNPPKSEFIDKEAEGYVRFVQITDFKTDKSAVYVPISSKNKMVYKGEIIMAAYRHIGKLSREMEGAFNVALCKILEFSPMNRDFIELLVGTDVVKGELLRASERGHIPSMHSDHLLSLLVPLPPLKEQSQIVAKVKELYEICDLLAEKISLASETKIQLSESMVQKALS